MNSLFHFRFSMPRSLVWLLATVLVVSSAQAQFQTFALAGHVTRASDGQPVQASVCVYSTKSLNDNNFYMMFKGITDDKGAYSFAMTANAQYKVVAFPWDANYETQYYKNSDRLETASVITLSSNVTNIDFSLVAKPVYDNGIRGIVVDAKGTTIVCQLVAWQTNSPNSQTYYASTDKSANGVFTFSNLKPGQYVIHAVPITAGYAQGFYRLNDVAIEDASLATLVTVAATGFVTPQLSVILAEQAIVSQKFGLKGIIMDEDGVALEGVSISISDSKSKAGVSKAVSDKSGMFYCEFSASSGEYLITATKTGYEDVSMTMPFDEKMPYQSITLQMQAVVKSTYNNTLSGRVRDNGDVSVLAKVTALRVLADGSISWNNAQTTVASLGSTGEFRFTNLRPGTYVLYASPANADLSAGYYVANGTASQDALFATRIDVSDKSGNLLPYVITLGKNSKIYSYDFYGYVMDETGSPLSDVTISATDANGNEVLLNQLNMSDKNGYFHCVFPGPGNYSLHMTKEGYQDASGTLTFTSANYAQKSVITMARKQGAKSMPDAAIIAEVKNDDIIIGSLYPQPATDILQCNTLGSAFDEIRIYDANGSVVSSQLITAQSSVQIDVSSLQSGVYALGLMNHGTVTSRRLFVKQ